MKKGWEVKKLGELVNIRTGKLNANAMIDGGQYPFFTCSREIFSIDKYSFDCEAILLAGNNASGDFNVKHYKGKFDAYQRTYVITVKEDNKLLYSYLKHQLINHLKKFKIQSVGANTKFLKLGMIQGMELSVPPLEEQQRIVSILDEAFAVLDQAKENVQCNLQNAKELFQSELNSIFATKGEGWEEKKLGEIFEIKPSKSEAKKKLGDADYVSFLPMEDLGIQIKDVYPQKKRQLKDVVGSYTYFAEGDVLLAKITPCFENGKLGIARSLNNGIGFGSSEYIVFRPTGAVIADYLFYYLSRNSFRQEGENKMQGAVGHKRVAKDFIENYSIPFPFDKKEQQNIVSHLEGLADEISKLEVIYLRKLNGLEELKKSLLQKAFSGQLTTTKELVYDLERSK